MIWQVRGLHPKADAAGAAGARFVLTARMYYKSSSVNDRSKTQRFRVGAWEGVFCPNR